ncbi:MAG: tetratricopeptide repeat protein, partial [Flavipsychrobacter sp.]|nr:tetratricopeptide repeat protein [Flavipsychrobacter sp.]
NTEWKNNYTLFSADVKKAPEDARLWANLAYETSAGKGEVAEGQQVGRGLLEESVSYYETSLQLYPPYINAHKDLAEVFIKLQRYDLAEEQYKQVLELSVKNRTGALSDLGYVYFLERKFTESIQMCKQSLIANPTNMATYNNMVICYTYARQYDSAIMMANKALQIEPGNVTIKGSLDVALKGQQQAKEADTTTYK